MHGGTITSGRCAHLRRCVGVYWISWISSFSNTTLPGRDGEVAADLEGRLVGHGDAALGQVLR